ncbi:class I SAM-dependent methyltransferase [Paeniglutamicibacter psychrophenolicus]|uniref:class I SAM-dependent methyltransferase n=1 Tax=Paeniglutamicibacter psychrophenolicus TaxID=257454 RepID=UPI002787D5F6|nr:class I SAM-dependent methyltransferase [Paeniglutamicibacter psychrophenolicus]MDQ0095170.1 SAM-dependent methyltransferase [Paeniglutamicibacter psychrophenolicus]
MSKIRVRDAYCRRAEEYIQAVGSMDHVHRDDRELVLKKAKLADGLVLDAGCGPGHWTNFLQEHGAEVTGVDLAPAFVERARQRFPRVPFRDGSLEDLQVPDGSVAGILSWYSIIHTDPGDVGKILDEFARCLKPGGYLVAGFFEGPRLEAFDHQIVGAYRWPVHELSGALEDAGFSVRGVRTRTDPGRRPHGAILARKDLGDNQLGDQGLGTRFSAASPGVVTRCPESAPVPGGVPGNGDDLDVVLMRERPRAG